MTMQDILNDIELDVTELKCLLQASSAETNPRLEAVAERSIERLKQRLDELKQRLRRPAPAEEQPQPADEEAPHEPLPADDAPILAERIRPSGGFRHALSLNDTFHFARELFGGDTSALNALLARMEEARSAEEARLLFAQAVHATEDNPAVPEFEELLNKYFDQ